MNNKTLLTKEKVKEFEKELKELIDIKRPNVIKMIQNAREQGDLSENSDYDAAKEEQALIEKRIKEIETILNNYEILPDKAKSDVIKVGSKVSFETNGKTVNITIVGELEADLEQNKISNVSPIAKALLGNKVGDKVKVTGIEKSYYITIKSVS